MKEDSFAWKMVSKVRLFFLCIKGEKVTIPEGTIITNVVTADAYSIAI